MAEILGLEERVGEELEQLGVGNRGDTLVGEILEQYLDVVEEQEGLLGSGEHRCV